MDELSRGGAFFTSDWARANKADLGFFVNDLVNGLESECVCVWTTAG